MLSFLLKISQKESILSQKITPWQTSCSLALVWHVASLFYLPDKIQVIRLPPTKYFNSLYLFLWQVTSDKSMDRWHETHPGAAHACRIRRQTRRGRSQSEKERIVNEHRPQLRLRSWWVMSEWDLGDEWGPKWRWVRRNIGGRCRCWPSSRSCLGIPTIPIFLRPQLLRAISNYLIEGRIVWLLCMDSQLDRALNKTAEN